MENSLLAVRETNNNVLRIAIDGREHISQIRIQMDKIGLPDKISFHKQASEILYFDLLKSYMNKNNLEAKVIKLEEQIKREKTTSKGCKTQVKKLEIDLVNLGSKPNEKNSNKKLIEEKDKLIESIQNNLEGSATDHPQTEDIMVNQAKNEELKKENLELKAKLIQVTKEKEELLNKSVVEVPPSTSQPVDTNELTRPLAQVSLKEKEISQLL